MCRCSWFADSIDAWPAWTGLQRLIDGEDPLGDSALPIATAAPAVTEGVDVLEENEVFAPAWQRRADELERWRMERWRTELEAREAREREARQARQARQARYMDLVSPYRTLPRWNIHEWVEALSAGPSERCIVGEGSYGRVYRADRPVAMANNNLRVGDYLQIEVETGGWRTFRVWEITQNVDASTQDAEVVCVDDIDFTETVEISNGQLPVDVRLPPPDFVAPPENGCVLWGPSERWGIHEWEEVAREVAREEARVREARVREARQVRQEAREEANARRHRLPGGHPSALAEAMFGADAAEAAVAPGRRQRRRERQQR